MKKSFLRVQRFLPLFCVPPTQTPSANSRLRKQTLAVSKEKIISACSACSFLVLCSTCPQLPFPLRHNSAIQPFKQRSISFFPIFVQLTHNHEIPTPNTPANPFLQLQESRQTHPIQDGVQRNCCHPIIHRR
jgi:hypothetical protein